MQDACAHWTDTLCGDWARDESSGRGNDNANLSATIHPELLGTAITDKYSSLPENHARLYGGPGKARKDITHFQLYKTISAKHQENEGEAWDVRAQNSKIVEA